MELRELLSRRGAKLTALTGAGGKTTLLTQLAQADAAAGLRTLVYTTTRMGREQADPFAIMPAGEGAPALARWPAGRPLFAGSCPDAMHWGPPRAALAAELTALAQRVYVEADGSRRMPVKLPAPWEPVLPEGATVLTVMGLSAIGQPLRQVCHRWELAQQRFPHAPELLTPELLAAIIAEGYGRFRPIVALHQADSPEREAAGRETAAALARLGIDEVCLTKRGFSC